MTRMQKFLMVLKVIEVRLRFIAVLVVTFLAIVYWDTLANYWDKWMRPAAAESTGILKGEEYFCPMDPGVIRDRPDPGGKTPQCPICGMPLSLRKKGAVEPLPPGVTGRVQLSPQRVQLAGVQTVEVAYRPMILRIVAVGSVAYDESRLSQVVSRVGGYVEKLHVDRTFVPVEKDQPLVEIYSPELYSTLLELQTASRRGAKDSFAQHARERLKLFGVEDADIDAIITSGKVLPTLVLRAPRGGQVIGKPIVLGMKVEAGMILVEIADLSAVWIEADVFEKDIGNLHLGQAIEATVEAAPGKTFAGKIAAIYSRLNTDTRTNRVRFEVQNDSGELRPGMFATVRIDAPITALKAFEKIAKDGRVPAVPETAVIDTGAEKIVYIERKPGVFEGVQVELGPQIDGYYPVLKGLAAGEKIVAAGSFLIDAETRLKPSAGVAYTGMSGGPKAEKPQTVISSTTVAADVSDEALKNIEKLPPEDQKPAKQQRLCPITNLPLGSMGVPVAISLDGQKVFLCCAGCIEKAKKNAEETLKKIAELKKK
ncbi:MAG: efflux RND transporter periplasmic adaptor subunit [Pirellulales bacterium]|nr:efflux RND transporter periplasmic adaptor subunit [Pirellulales bacterium]